MLSAPNCSQLRPARQTQFDLAAGDADALEGCAHVSAAGDFGVSRPMQFSEPLRLSDFGSRLALDHLGKPRNNDLHIVLSAG